VNRPVPLWSQRRASFLGVENKHRGGSPVQARSLALWTIKITSRMSAWQLESRGLSQLGLPLATALPLLIQLGSPKLKLDERFSLNSEFDPNLGSPEERQMPCRRFTGERPAESEVVHHPGIVVSGDVFPHHGMARIRRLNHPTEIGVRFTLQDNLGLTGLIDL